MRGSFIFTTWDHCYLSCCPLPDYLVKVLGLRCSQVATSLKVSSRQKACAVFSRAQKDSFGVVQILFHPADRYLSKHLSEFRHQSICSGSGVSMEVEPIQLQTFRSFDGGTVTSESNNLEAHKRVRVALEYCEQCHSLDPSLVQIGKNIYYLNYIKRYAILFIFRKLMQTLFLV